MTAQPDTEPKLDTELPANTAAAGTEVPSLRRILVALDASTHSHTALAAAVTLAVRFGAEIEGIFVEDLNLLRLVELPFVREIRFGQKGAGLLEGEPLHRWLRARATLLRHELDEVASQHKVLSTFRVARGLVAAELLTAAREADLLALGRIGHSVASRARLGSTARAAVSQAASAVLLVQPEVQAGPVLVLFDGSAAAMRALELARQLGSDTGELRVLIWGPDEQSAFDRRQLAAHLLSQNDAQYQHLAGGDASRVLNWVNKQHGSVLITPTVTDGWPDGTLDALLDDAQPHLLIVR